MRVHSGLGNARDVLQFGHGNEWHGRKQGERGVKNMAEFPLFSWSKFPVTLHNFFPEPKLKFESSSSLNVCSNVILCFCFHSFAFALLDDAPSLQFVLIPSRFVFFSAIAASLALLNALYNVFSFFRSPLK